eukprot:TRINITY_DN157_c0_g3_i2.p1 TRINITY_DN157_c0_g3~~TRINITY_DN157_c0_g3_i2.p1  ORF type:complete len:165 (-),score=56.81 TRINITY_DN157_c0_g3_i2:39-533(-)
MENFEKIFSKFSYGMFTTLARDGKIRSRPMQLLQLDSQHNIWMVTGKDSEKVYELQKDSRADLILQSSDQWMSVSGTVRFSEDTKKIDELWNEHLQVYFPGGKTDPNILLIKLETDEAEYWDKGNLGKKISYAFAAGKAYLKGEKLNPEKESTVEHEKVSLQAN